jgi:mannobiose 2-epimerase
VRDKICDARGYLNLYFEPNWKPVPDVDSYGHDVETAFLLLEAAERLGRANEPETQRIARALVDHALKFGWDAKYGGFYDQGPIEAPATVTDKGWWMQAEGLNALLLMHELYGRSSPDYYKAFEAQWSFITRFQLDPKYGDWWNVVARDGKVLHPETGKGGEWKEAYHQSRALMNTADRLRRLATRSGARLAWSDGKNLRDGPRRPAGAVRSTRQPPPLPLFRTSCSKNLPAELACPPRRTKALWQRAPARIRFW